MFLSSFLAFFFVASAAQASSFKMIYMRENSEGKHIYMSDLEGKNAQKLTAGAEWHLYPDITPAGDEFTYIMGTDETNLNVMTRNFKTRAIEKWNKNPSIFYHPKYARNGEYLFYSMKDEAGKQSIVWLNLEKERTSRNYSIDVMGGEVVRVYNPRLNTLKETSSAYFPNPSSDASFVVYHRVDGLKKREVVLYDLATHEVTVIDEGMSPSLSKDDRYIAYTKNEGGNWDIWRWDRHTKVKTKLTTHPAKDYAPSWRADGKLVFASDRLRSDEFDFYLFDQGKVTPLLVVNEGSVYAAKFSGNTKIEQQILAPILGVPRSSFGAIHYNGKIYVAGGHQGREHTYPPESFTNRVDVYDVTAGKWKSIAPRNYKCHGFQLAAYGKYVYAFGGFAYSENYLPKWTSLDVIERYDTERNVWEIVGRMPRKRSSNVALTVGTKVYLMGGWDSTPKKPNDVNGTFHSEIDVFDMLNETITTLDVKLPMKRRAFTGIVKDQKIMLIGGISEGGSHFSLLDDVTLFDPADNSFATIARLPYATFAPAAGVIGNELYVFGGMFKTGEWNYEYVSHIYQYSLNNLRSENVWHNTGRTLKESKGFSQVVQMPEGLGILGGHTYQDNQDAPVSTFEWFKLSK